MKRELNAMIYIDKIRGELGFLPKKCKYEIVNGEVMILELRNEKVLLV